MNDTGEADMSVARGTAFQGLILPGALCAILATGCAAPVLGTGDGVAELEIHPDLILSKFDGATPLPGKSGQYGPGSRIWSISRGKHEVQVSTSSVVPLGGGKVRMQFSTATVRFEAQPSHRYFITTGVLGQTLKSDGSVRVVDRTDRTCWYGGDEGPVPCGEGRPSWAPAK